MTTHFQAVQTALIQFRVELSAAKLNSWKPLSSAQLAALKIMELSHERLLDQIKNEKDQPDEITFTDCHRGTGISGSSVSRLLPLRDERGLKLLIAVAEGKIGELTARGCHNWLGHEDWPELLELLGEDKPETEIQTILTRRRKGWKKQLGENFQAEALKKLAKKKAEEKSKKKAMDKSFARNSS